MLGPIQLGKQLINPPLILSPMAGVTNRAFRLLCHEQGAGLVFTEMVSDKGLLHGNQRTRDLLYSEPDEGPVGVQLFGAEPAAMAEAAQSVADLGFVCIDINMGCPARKVARGSGAGVALMKDPELVHEIVRAVVAAVGPELPITAKMRSGWDEDSVNAVEIARAAVAAGAALVSIHGRTGEQKHQGKADRDIIRAVKEAVEVPVCGSGDVFEPQDAVELIQETGCDGVLFARGTLGNPWLFARTLEYLRSGEVPPEPSLEERFETLLRHLDLLVGLKGERSAVREMRRHAAWYTKGLYGSSRFRNKVNRAVNREELRAIVRNYQHKLRSPEEAGKEA